MGYGGNLIWTSVIKTLHERDGRPLAVVTLPGLSDVLAGRLYDSGSSLKSDEIFRGNPRLVFPPSHPKSAATKLIDRLFMRALSVFEPLREAYELFIFGRSEGAVKRGDVRLLHIDMRIHSYGGRHRNRKIEWKPHARAADAVLAHFQSGQASDDCEIYLTASEDAAALALIENESLAGGFVAIEPDTNREFFGDLRAWPRERWAAFLERLSKSHPRLKTVQIGVPDAPPLPGVIDFRGRVDFRTACALIKRARLFIGTEGGLMHAANAVNAKALILWGGVTLPEFAGYPKRQRTICKYVACAPCGNLGWCENGHICMRQITVDEVAVAASQILSKQTA